MHACRIAPAVFCWRVVRRRRQRAVQRRCCRPRAGAGSDLLGHPRRKRAHPTLRLDMCACTRRSKAASASPVASAGSCIIVGDWSSTYESTSTPLPISPPGEPSLRHPGVVRLFLGGFSSAVLSAQVDDLSKTLAQARASAGTSSDSLAELTQRAEDAAAEEGGARGGVSHETRRTRCV